MCTRPADETAPEAESTVECEGLLTGTFATPWGEGTVTICRGGLVGVELPPVRGGGSPRSPYRVSEADQQAVIRWVGELEAYFCGKHLAWTAEQVSLETLPVGNFARTVYKVLLTVSPGVAVSYGALARMAGYPRAARAVGTAMAKNPVPVVVPCHRVIRSDGSLGRYGDDPAWKERLLIHERMYAGGMGGER